MSTARPKRLARRHLNSVRKKRFLKKRVFDHSRALSEQLNFTQLWPYFSTPRYQFLSNEELNKLDELPTDRLKANKLLGILRSKPWRAIRKFLACVFEEDEHSGHEDLSKLFRSVLPPEEVEEIKQLTRKQIARVNYGNRRRITKGTSVTSYRSMALVRCDGSKPELPITLLQYEGCLVREKYNKLDRRLWDHFSNGKYDDLAMLTKRISASIKLHIDVKIVGRWFESLILMHRDGNYKTCLREILKPALNMCTESEVQNRNILEGRICQRMAQVYLVMGKKEKATKYFNRAKGLLQFVARGYEKVNMFCREAKIMCATMPEKRKEIEEMFCMALGNVSEDDSFALASIPSIILSKAAFHLRISFGSKPSSSDVEKVLLPTVSTSDKDKARNVLKCLPTKNVLLTMRKCEYKLLHGELMRLDGETDTAIQTFEEVIRESKTAKLNNIIACAEHRIQVMKAEREWDESIEEILEEKFW